MEMSRTSHNSVVYVIEKGLLATRFTFLGCNPRVYRNILTISGLIDVVSRPPLSGYGYLRLECDRSIAARSDQINNCSSNG